MIFSTPPFGHPSKGGEVLSKYFVWNVTPYSIP